MPVGIRRLLLLGEGGIIHQWPRPHWNIPRFFFISPPVAQQSGELHLKLGRPPDPPVEPVCPTGLLRK